MTSTESTEPARLAAAAASAAQAGATADPAKSAVPVPRPQGEPVLEVRGLCVDYGLGPGGVQAVFDADLTLHRGEVLGLAGESGSGKSTLAYAVTRLLRAPGVITGGEVLFHSRPASHGDAPAGPEESIDLLSADAATLRRIRWSELSVVFQSAMHALNPVARVERQLTDVLRAHRPDLSAEARHERAVELLRMVGISADRLRAYPHELSGGMRQRAMIAMALALEPQVVIMDEPTTALDVVTQREILEELMQLRERLGFAVVFITHDLSLLLEMADSIAIMYAGRIVERAGAAELFRAPRHPYTLGLLNSFPALHGERVRMEGIPGSPPSLSDLPKGCTFHPRCPFAMDVCREQEPPLRPAVGDVPHRRVSCWLQDGSGPVPVELSARPPSGTTTGTPAPQARKGDRA
ncbi:ABC transporter ATP-binding protein [Phaeacidiphilus oryzae]|uniref:ABC transporter ATP-binding protein n=1 Tax=Phaeacidiphilus oryzae TaxID=348818 RepID=UPI0007C6CE7F|nr:ABC transporter ATP-binding protein [Phaeacidiphilus oryzae]